MWWLMRFRVLFFHNLTSKGMSYKVYFMFSESLKSTIRIEVGTKDKLWKHFGTVEDFLNENCDSRDKQSLSKWLESGDYETVKKDVLCKNSLHHNFIVRNFYDDLKDWAEKDRSDKRLEVFEEFSNDDFQLMLPNLKLMNIPVELWNSEYYRDMMETFYEVMRGRECKGISFDTKKLTEKQASNVIRLFAEFLDGDSLNLDVPKGHDYLASSYDGGYEWCEKCGAITYDDSVDCSRKKCPLIAEWGIEN